MRTVISIPILHTVADLGSVGSFLREEFTRRYGPDRWAEHCRLVDGTWEEIRRQVAALGLSATQVRIYQDGLPRCGKELDIVRTVAAAGSRNYQLVLELVESGAILEGTEDAELLKRERTLLRQVAAVRDPVMRDRLAGELEEETQRLLRARDSAVADRINQTLQDGEWGLLFMGLQHGVEAHLDRDIAVRMLLSLPPGKRPAANADPLPPRGEACGVLCGETGEPTGEGH